jgi:hypothetical protein
LGIIVRSGVHGGNAVAKLAKPAKTTLQTHPGPEAKPEVMSEYTATVLRSAREGNEETVPQLRKWLTVEASVSRAGADLGAQVQASLARKMARNDFWSRETVLKNGENLRNEICGSNATPLVLAERVVICWTYQNYLEFLYTQSADNLTLA